MARPRRKTHDYFNCPFCGAEVPVGAEFCRECGASEDSGWEEGTESAALDESSGYTPADDFDYDDFIRREFPDQVESEGYPWKRLVIGLIVGLLAIALLLSALGHW